MNDDDFPLDSGLMTSSSFLRYGGGLIASTCVTYFSRTRILLGVTPSRSCEAGPAVQRLEEQGTRALQNPLDSVIRTILSTRDRPGTRHVLSTRCTFRHTLSLHASSIVSSSMHPGKRCSRNLLSTLVSLYQQMSQNQESETSSPTSSKSSS